MKTNEARIVYCSFCGISQHEVVDMIAGPVLVAICDICVAQCVEVLDAKRAERAEAAAATAAATGTHYG